MKIASERQTLKTADFFFKMSSLDCTHARKRNSSDVRVLVDCWLPGVRDLETVGDGIPVLLLSSIRVWSFLDLDEASRAQFGLTTHATFSLEQNPLHLPPGVMEFCCETTSISSACEVMDLIAVSFLNPFTKGDLCNCECGADVKSRKVKSQDIYRSL